jgi:hypothetical protein
VTPAALGRLAGLVEARKARDLARLEGLVAENGRLEAEIAALAATGTRDLGAAEALPLAQQGLRARWAEARIRAARARRAELAAAIRAARAEAVQSLGKHRALEELVDRAEREVPPARAARGERGRPDDGAGPTPRLWLVCWF